MWGFREDLMTLFKMIQIKIVSKIVATRIQLKTSRRIEMTSIEDDNVT